ncbi:MAG TPA: ATP-binding protein [Lapillicoccus sp.]|uniref:sensor histidine kinase n=1 Tax=Lapillicoccus sp. TaxID=1909287 RepID=UPI002F953717
MARHVPRSLAGQAAALMLGIVLVIVVLGGALAALDARRDGDDAARERVVAIASSLAAAPSTAAALESGQPTATLQPVTERVRHDTQIAFITIMSPDGTRYTHTDPSLIGQKYLGTTEPALRGETFTEVFTGTLGPSIRAVAPVYASDGRIVGLVSAGITQQTLAENWYAQLPLILLVAATTVVAAVVGMWLVRRRLLRQTGGLSPRELRVMYEHHDAVLHSISEGLVVVENERAVLINDEARRLLDVSDDVPIDMRSLPAFLADGDGRSTDESADRSAGRSAEPSVKDEVRLTKDRVLVVNRAPVAVGQRMAADVVTIRDRTELQGALGELDSMKVFAESLRSQAHESANRLHTIVALVEMGRGDEAVRFATTQLELSQRLVDRLTAAVQEPALVALLLGKSAQAAERGIALTVTDDTHLDTTLDATFDASLDANSDSTVGAEKRGHDAGAVLTPTEMITVVGNLVDNAFDACDKDDPWVEVTVQQDDAALRIVVADSGPGMDEATFEQARRRGYSTKEGGAEGRRGLGLALVSQVVERHGGQLTAEVTYGSVVSVTIERGAPHRRRS